LPTKPPVDAGFLDKRSNFMETKLILTPFPYIVYIHCSINFKIEELYCSDSARETFTVIKPSSFYKDWRQKAKLSHLSWPVVEKEIFL